MGEEGLIYFVLIFPKSNADLSASRVTVVFFFFFKRRGVPFAASIACQPSTSIKQGKVFYSLFKIF